MHSIDVSLLILRAVFGVFLLVHGVNKIRNGLDGTARWFASIGMSSPGFQARAASLTEIVAGAGLAAGFLTPLACSAVVGVMTVAIVTVHARVGFFIFLPDGGWEYCASIIAVAAAVAVAGPGTASVDHLLSLHPGPTVGAVAVGGGLVVALLHLALKYRPAGRQQ